MGCHTKNGPSVGPSQNPEPPRTNAALEDTAQTTNQDYPPNDDRICSKCLAPGHLISSCTSQVRCNICYNYGHKSFGCLSINRKKQIFRAKIKQLSINTARIRGGNPVSSSPASSPEGFLDSPASATSPPTSTESMANYPCDFIPHLPVGA